MALTVIKLGGSLITDKRKPFSVKRGVLHGLAQEIAEAHVPELVVAHGGGSFPHVPASRYALSEGLRGAESMRGFALTQDAAGRLNRIVVAALLANGTNAVSLQPSAACIARNGAITFFAEPLKRMISAALVPVPYGDILIDTERGCCIASTERIIEAIARQLRTARVIICGITDGVLDAHGDTIPEVGSGNLAQVLPALKTSHGIDVTGGMRSKVREAMAIAKHARVQIINGARKGNLAKALAEEDVPGTVVKQ
jgi:isopentenyl phosphate kinase